MKARIPKNLETIDSKDNEIKEVKITPELNMTIKPKKSKKRTKGIERTPSVAVQQNAIKSRVNELFNEELEDRGTDKRSEILFEMTKTEFIEIFHPKSIRKYAKLAVSNILNAEIKSFIQALVEQKRINSESTERKILEDLHSNLDNPIEEYFRVEVSEDEIEELQEYIKGMQEYARKEIEKRIINAIETEEKEKVEEQEEIPDEKAQIIEPEEKQEIIRNAMQEVEPEILRENIEALNEGKPQDTQPEEQGENDSNAEEGEKEEDIKLSYFEEVMSFTNGFSFFCKNSMIYAAETGHRKKFQDLGNYMKFYELRYRVQSIMNTYEIRESRAMKKILEDSKKLLKSGVLDQEDLEVLEAAKNNISAIEYQQQMAKKEEGR